MMVFVLERPSDRSNRSRMALPVGSSYSQGVSSQMRPSLVYTFAPRGTLRSETVDMGTESSESSPVSELELASESVGTPAKASTMAAGASFPASLSGATKPAPDSVGAIGGVGVTVVPTGAADEAPPGETAAVEGASDPLRPSTGRRERRRTPVTAPAAITKSTIVRTSTKRRVPRLAVGTSTIASVVA